MGEENCLPVGLCRMKNRKGLSTINQGGDDLAIRIAAMEKNRETHCTSSPRPARQLGPMDPRCWFARTHLIPVPQAGHVTTGPNVPIYWTPTVGQALYLYHFIYSTQAPSSLIKVFTLHKAFMRLKWPNILQPLEQCLPLNTQCVFTLSAVFFNRTICLPDEGPGPLSLSKSLPYAKAQLRSQPVSFALGNTSLMRDLLCCGSAHLVQTLALRSKLLQAHGLTCAYSAMLTKSGSNLICLWQGLAGG